MAESDCERDPLVRRGAPAPGSNRGNWEARARAALVGRSVRGRGGGAVAPRVQRRTASGL